MSFPHHIFKAYDIRGIVEDALTPAMVEMIGRAFGSEAIEQGVKQVVIGRDGRLTGVMLVEALAKGIMSTGCDVIDIGQVPTPALYFATKEYKCGTGIEVTGSHNPPEYNGLKMMINGDTLAGESIQRLKHRILDESYAVGEGSLETRDVLPTYVQRIVDDVKLASPLKVVIDCGNGVGGAVAGEIFRRIGCDVTELFCEVDGNFPNHHPDPSQVENLEDLIAKVKEVNADLGMAFDGDADRLGVIAPSGDIIWADRQMILFAQDILQARPGAEIIFDVKCSQVLAKEIEKMGGKATMWKTGHSLVKAKLKETGAAIAGEMSGHIFFNDRWGGFDDGLYAGARMCELLSKRRTNVQAVFDALPNTVNTPELRLDLAEGENFVLIEELVAKAQFDDANVSNIDGLRVDFEDGFGLARASNTTPSVIMRFEASNQARLEQIQTRFRDLLLSIRADLDLPF